MFKFNGTHATDPSLGILRRTIRTIFPLLPGTTDYTLDIVGRHGSFDQGYTYQPRIIRVQFLIRRSTADELFEYARTVAAWLNTPEAKPFIFDREPDKFYMARPQGEVPLDRILYNAGYCDVSFIAPEPWAFALESVTETATGSIEAENSGTLPCPVVIEATIKESADGLIVGIDETGEHIEVNRALETGDVVVIDTNARTCMVNGADARADMTFHSEWLKLPRGGFTLTADPASTELEITFRERWI